MRELITARGSTYANPPANYYRANRDPVTRAEATAQVFLGMRLQCAKCHNHPFDRWTQDDYYRWAGVFARVQYKVLENNRRDKNDKHEFDGEQIVYTGPHERSERPAHRRAGRSREFLGAKTTELGRRRPPGGAGRLAHQPREPAVRPRAGEPHLVSPDGPRHRRSDRRFPRDQPAQQSRRCSTSWLATSSSTTSICGT